MELVIAEDNDEVDDDADHRDSGNGDDDGDD